MANCDQLEKNKEQCTCTNTSCALYGNCCACVARHRAKDEIPGCFFSPEAEKEWDRSVEFFIKSKSN
ncbi:DUF6485 family protein [Halanaerobaculum tunisiense]